MTNSITLEENPYQHLPHPLRISLATQCYCMQLLSMANLWAGEGAGWVHILFFSALLLVIKNCLSRNDKEQGKKGLGQDQ